MDSSGRPPAVAALLFFSGCSALIYQTVWFREFRLIFGGSTFATAAVLAVFMGGLGAGSAILGPRADRRSSPLAFYANLELLIATTAALSLPLLWLARQAYIATGGSPRMGLVAATVMRLLLAAVILAVPTVLMGGTLPAAARAVERTSERRSVALLYATNTAGAVTGVVISTFFLLETYGSRQTLLMAALVNLIVGMTARSLARTWPDSGGDVDDGIVHKPLASPVGLPVPLVLACAAVAGFVFLLMELVWYRMLGPILGGTTFTFGLILAFALAGIAIGGYLYRAVRPSASALAVTSSLEALAIVLPFAAGDRIAALAELLRPLGAGLGFGGYVLGWSLVALIVVAPAAVIAGVQFPLLIALLGRGRERVGGDIGAAYVWNTAGAIVGSLAGGFGLLPLMTAPGAWRFATLLLALLGVALAVYAMLHRERAFSILAIVLALGSLTATAAEGPTAFWRHSAIGAGLLPPPDSKNVLLRQRNQYRSWLLWDADGRESSVAMISGEDLAFYVNGKSDGAAVGDAGTQIMIGLVGALIHPAPRTALVVGLGTGETAGWLASVPSMSRVDVVELEPVVLRVANDCALVNQNALRNPKVHVALDDAREVLLTTPRRYDLVVSEPSNPYRAGIASLYTREYYTAVARRLRDHGIFLQWTQAYDIDAPTLRTIYATISSVFPNVQTYWTTPGDMLLVATREPLQLDGPMLRRRLNTEPFRSGTLHAWGVNSLEGFLSHVLLSEAGARKLARDAREINTDDKTVIEFSFARSVSKSAKPLTSPMAELARQPAATQRVAVRGPVDWKLVAANRAASNIGGPPATDPELVSRQTFAALALAGNLKAAAELWGRSPWRPASAMDGIALTEALADVGNENASVLVDQVRSFDPGAANAILARLRFRQGRFAESANLLAKAFQIFRTNPWCDRQVMRRAMELAMTVANAHPGAAPSLYAALEKPFAVLGLDLSRRTALLAIASDREGCGPGTLNALRKFEPYPPWQREHLTLRADCYARAGLKDLAMAASRDLETFESAEAEPLLEGR